MDNSFEEILPELNKKYFLIFGDIPCITDYSCTRGEFVHALEEAILERKEISNFLKGYQNPIKGVEI